MAIEPRRLCQYRKVNGLYLCGEYFHSPCDRLPLELKSCPVCGGGIKVSRGFTKINPYRLWGPHEIVQSASIEHHGQLVDTFGNRCTDRLRPCHVCDPKDEIAFIMGVGQGYYKTPDDFLNEAHRMGISKKIPFIPKELRLGVTVVYLAHPKACEARVPAVMQQAMAIVEESETEQPKLLEAERKEKRLGIFCAFIPHRVEKLIWQSEATPEELEKLEKRGITPVIVPDGDSDHA